RGFRAADCADEVGGRHESSNSAGPGIVYMDYSDIRGAAGTTGEICLAAATAGPRQPAGKNPEVAGGCGTGEARIGTAATRIGKNDAAGPRGSRIHRYANARRRRAAARRTQTESQRRSR